MGISSLDSNYIKPKLSPISSADKVLKLNSNINKSIIPTNYYVSSDSNWKTSMIASREVIIIFRKLRFTFNFGRSILYKYYKVNIFRLLNINRAIYFKNSYI